MTTQRCATNILDDPAKGARMRADLIDGLIALLTWMQDMLRRVLKNEAAGRESPIMWNGQLFGRRSFERERAPSKSSLVGSQVDFLKSGTGQVATYPAVG